MCLCVFLAEFEALRQEKSAIAIQSLARMYLARVQSRADIRDLTILQNQWRARIARNEYRSIKVGPVVSTLSMVKMHFFLCQCVVINLAMVKMYFFV